MSNDKLLEAVCVFCGYNGEGYYQAGTHHLSCPWFNVGGQRERAVALASMIRATWVRMVQAEAERDEAQSALDGWVKWASSSRCIYCGQEFVHDPHDQEGADESKKAHVLACAKHPMVQAQAALTEARRVLREALRRSQWKHAAGCYWQHNGAVSEAEDCDCDVRHIKAALAAVLAQEEQ